MAIPFLVQQARSHALGDVLRRSAARRPDKPALICGDVRWSYRELDDTVNRAANALAQRGVRHGDRVALLSHNGWEFVVVSYALARLGAVLVPINFMLGASEVAFILGHSGARGLIVEDALHPVAEQALVQAPEAGRLRGWISPAGQAAPAGWEAVAEWTRHPSAQAPEVVVGDEDPLRIMYTSGTESRPKGVLLSSRSIIAQYVSCIVDGGMAADDVDLHALPLYHCAQLDCFLGPDLYLGATNIVLRGPDPELMLATIERERVTKLFAPPTVWIALMNAPSFDTTDLSSLRKGYYGASAMPVEVLRAIARRLPDVRLWNFYGQTEMAPVATILPPEEQLARPGSAGRAVLNVETRVVDDAGRDVPPGTVGEIVHRSPQATLGYYEDAARTAEAFAGGWFHTGDLGVLTDDGYLAVVDRKKDMIKTGGENVASREIEETLYAMPEIAEVAVFGLPHPYWVEAVVAAVVPAPGVTLEPAAVQAFCRSQLAGFKVPKTVVIVESLPKNPSGKVLKRALRDQFEALASSIG
jgi:fatty-acyl-CoA synthase